MATVNESVEVAVPVRTAYNQWTQFESFPEFMPGVESVTQVDDATVRWVARIGSRERTFQTHIVEQAPDELIAWEAEDGLQMSGRVTFEEIEIPVGPKSPGGTGPVFAGPAVVGLETGAVARGAAADVAGEPDAVPHGHEGTRVHVEFTWNPEGFLEHMGHDLRLDSRQVKEALKRFKTVVEGRGEAVEGWRGQVHDGRATGG